ncbi:conjugal transfer protein TraM [Dokdonia sp. Dokd-P16]|uniref:conjugative transposon protein TraM n=1 Tax=Dokdonia sp. Dokd-P16 TaxID=2173169 RepID=UPI000D54944E|nr:conjugative transposon protein TraM [Dokdonia sp. Dokd-P16]AWH75484.1 conjugal transfer protein TraM [Dokdonia sp. Dokd-P16]
MKIEKNKIVFASVLAVIFIFLIAYSMLLMGDDDMESDNLEQYLIPDISDNQKEYTSKLDAINDLKKVRENNAPSIYDEKLIDSLGFYDPDLPEKEKERIVDSIYNAGNIIYSDRNYSSIKAKRNITKKSKIDSAEQERERKIKVKELGLEHQLFFAAAPKPNVSDNSGTTDKAIYVVVDGSQVVQSNSRIRMRLIKDAIINDKRIAKNTPIYGFISFQPNRVLISIEAINHAPTSLKAFDLQDGSEGIYIENNFRAEVTSEVVEDVLQDINIPSVPQVSGITKLLKQKNRNLKVTVLNNYKLILKPSL